MLGTVHDMLIVECPLVHSFCRGVEQESMIGESDFVENARPNLRRRRELALDAFRPAVEQFARGDRRTARNLWINGTENLDQELRGLNGFLLLTTSDASMVDGAACLDDCKPGTANQRKHGNRGRRHDRSVALYEFARAISPCVGPCGDGPPVEMSADIVRQLLDRRITTSGLLL